MISNPRMPHKHREVIDVQLNLGAAVIVTLERVAKEERMSMDDLIKRIVSDWYADEQLENY